MKPIRGIRRIAGVLAALGFAWLGIAVAAPAAFAAVSVPPPMHQHQPVLVRTVVVGGMPGWQIALIAIGAALLAASAAVLAYWAWTTRRQPVTPAPQPSATGADTLPVP